MGGRPQEYAHDIFEFINEVRNSPVNNGFFPFRFGRDIQELIRKQWAGMTFDFLTKRRLRDEFEVTTTLMENLTLASGKTEELLESIFRHLDKERADESIAQIDKELEARKFFQDVLGHTKQFETATIENILSIDLKHPWYEFLIQTDEFHITENVSVSGTARTVNVVAHNKTHVCFDISGELSDEEKKRFDERTKLFNSFKELTIEQKRKVLADFI